MRIGTIFVLSTLIIFIFSNNTQIYGNESTQKSHSTLDTTFLVDNNNKSIFNNYVNITDYKDFWNTRLVFEDFNNNEIPEILIGKSGSEQIDYNYKEGLHFFEYNGTNNFSHKHVDFNFSGDNSGMLYGIDYDGDDDLDLMSTRQVYVPEEGRYQTEGFFLKNEDNIFRLINWTFILPNNNSIHSPFIGDINSDGNFDFIVGSDSWDGIHAVINGKNGSFSVKGWNNGLPAYDENDPDHSLKYSSFQHGLWDINNDGCLDICSAMGNGGSMRNTGPCQFYNWISDGKGNWSSFSENFPTYERGLRLDLADVDNDGDLDYCLFTNKDRYMYENQNGKNWIRRPFPLNNISEFKFSDINQDGNIDLIMIQVIPNFIGENLILDFKNRIWVAYGNGNWSWKLENQITTNHLGYPGEIYVEDIDLDGDRDLIYCHNWEVSHNVGFGGIVCFYNEHENNQELLFIEKPVSPHIRGNSIYKFKWTSKYAKDYLGTSKNFTLLISYSGSNGPYYLLKNNIHKWDTNIVIPNIPSDDVYFKIIWNDLYTTAGPYTIYNIENITNIITLRNPKKGDFLIGNETVNLNFSISKTFETGPVNVILIHNNGSINVGKYIFPNNGFLSIPWKVPDGITEFECELLFVFSFHGKNITQIDHNRFSVVPMNEVPFSINSDNILCNLFNETPFSISVYSKDGNNLGDKCEYLLDFNPLNLNVVYLGKGQFIATPLKLGHLSMNISAMRYHRIVVSEIHFTSQKPITKIELYYSKEKIHVGEIFNLSISIIDDKGNICSLNDDEYAIKIVGDCRIISQEKFEIQMMGFAPGNITINITVFQPFIMHLESIKILPYMQIVKITPDEKIIFSNETILMEFNVFSFNGSLVEDLSISYSFQGPINIEKLQNKLKISPYRKGVVKIISSISRLNETLMIESVFQVIDDFGNVKFEPELEWIEVGYARNYKVKLFDSSGMVEITNFTISIGNKSEHIIMEIFDNIFINLYGIVEGRILFSISILYKEHIVLFEKIMDVENCPRSYNFTLPDFTFKDINVSFKLIVYNGLQVPFSDYTISVISDGFITSFNNGTLKLIGIENGIENIQINISNRNVSLLYNKSIIIYPYASFISNIKNEYWGYNGHPIEILPILLDKDNNKIKWSNWSVNVFSNDIEYKINDSMIFFKSNKSSIYSIDILTNFHGISLNISTKIIINPNSVIDKIKWIINEDDQIAEIQVNDQYGNNITRFCDIRWEGDFDLMTNYKVKSISNDIFVTVTLNGTTITKFYSFQKKTEFNMYLWILIIILILLTGIAIMIIYFKKSQYNVNNSKNWNHKKAFHGDNFIDYENEF